MSNKLLLAALGSCVALVGCKPKDLDNPDVAAGYRGADKNKYEADIVTGKKRKAYKDQGASIKPKTLRNIEDTIVSVYEKDFERCLEEQMDEHETRFLRAVFTVEFRIDTTGQAGDAKILNIAASKQNAKGKDLGSIDTGGMTSCISESIDQWEFEPPPEVDYVHTYNGQVGEAF